MRFIASVFCCLIVCLLYDVNVCVLDTVLSRDGVVCYEDVDALALDGAAAILYGVGAPAFNVNLGVHRQDGSVSCDGVVDARGSAGSSGAVASVEGQLEVAYQLLVAAVARLAGSRLGSRRFRSGQVLGRYITGLAVYGNLCPVAGNAGLGSNLSLAHGGDYLVAGARTRADIDCGGRIYRGACRVCGGRSRYRGAGGSGTGGQVLAVYVTGLAACGDLDPVAGLAVGGNGLTLCDNGNNAVAVACACTHVYVRGSGSGCSECASGQGCGNENAGSGNNKISL